MGTNTIDVVITWVDGSDMQWQRERNLWLKEEKNIEANGEIRYQNWENLKYLFRALEKNLPWANRIFLVTCNQIPAFLDVNHPKIRLVNHKDYMPEEYLPTFNSNSIEMNFHRIEDLGENFVYFNDDMFPLTYVPEEYYFQNGQVCDEAVESPIMPVDIGSVTKWSCSMKMNNLLFVNRHFSKRAVQEKNYDKWFFDGYGELLERNKGLSYWNNFVGFHDPHMPSAFKKSSFEKLWQVEPQTLHEASLNKFREDNDVSQYLVRYWQLCEGDFVPRKTEGKPYLVTMENYKSVAEDIRLQRYQMVCINEECTPDEFDIIKKEINDALELVYPEKSSYEI